MATEGKFGTFAGVYTPSLLTILGVIMYLRLPWVVGEGGLFVAIGVLLAAHVASVTTGLSVSSIATDKRVGAGGPYYIISRSFGLPIGGAIGVALFLGLSFSVSLYIVGFAQSFLGAIGIAPTANAIRVAGSITLLAITVITFISTSLAVKAQYVILVLVAGSLVAVFLGHHDAAVPHLSRAAGSPSFAELFGVFFPAVTGFMAGVNMSGDLEDPKGAIPKGTMLAIATGLAVYAAMMIYLAYTVDPATLRDDPEVLQHVALWAPAVVAGIWGATLSSALGSILGAPRILQAMSSDRITPRALAKGVGATNEPRRALMIAFVIAEGGILIAELDLIARVISMVFLALYAGINMTCTIESWASPDFRPRFRIPKLVSIVGALAALLLMIELDLVAMLGATALMLGLFVYLKRRQLTLEAGDTWEGVWSTLVRAGLQRLHRKTGERRNWRPNVLLFDEADHARHAPIRAFATTLASGNGMVTDFALAPPPGDEDEPAANPPARTTTVGVFDARVETTAPFATIASVCQYHGFSGLPPNTLLLPWRQHAADPDAFLGVLQAAARRGLNLLLFEEARDPIRIAQRRIDVWWARGAGNLALSVALARFITRAEDWEHAAISVLIVGEGSDEDEVLRAKATRHLEASRVEARVRVVHRPKGEQLHDLVCNESRPADLVLLGLPDDLAAADRASLERLGKVAALPGNVVFVRASGEFADVLVASGRAARAPRADSEPAPRAELPLPVDPELATVAAAIGAHERAQLGGAGDRIAGAYELYLELCATARELVERRTEALIAAVREAAPNVRRRLAARATATFVAEGEKALAALESDGIAAQATLLGETIAGLLVPGAGVPSATSAIVHIERPRAALRARPDDPPALRRWKRRCRWRWFYRRRIPQAIAIGPAARAAHERIVADVATRVTARFRRASHDLAVEIGRALATVEWKTHAQLSRVELADPDELIAQLEHSRGDALRRLDGIRTHTLERVAESRGDLERAVFEAARRTAGLLDRVDAAVAVRGAARERPDRGAPAELAGFAERWRDEQLQLIKRARVAVRLARFRDKLTIAGAAIVEDLVSAIRGSSYRACTELRAAIEAATAPPELRDELVHDPAPLVARFARTAAALTSDLPESEAVLTDDASAALVRGDAAFEVTTLAVRAAVQRLVETELIARLGAEGARLAEADVRAWAVARDTALLTSARPRDSEDEDPAPAESEPGAPGTDALARLDAQLANLRQIEAGLVAAVIDGLEAVAAATGLDALSSSLEERGGRGRELERPSRVRALARRGLARIRALAAGAIYRRSAGVVFAHLTQASRERSAADAIRGLAERSAVPPPVLAALPLYYRNLFIGQININESFFTGREPQIRAGIAALAGARPGALRSVLVTGMRGSGKTTLCQQIAIASGSTVHWVAAPPGGAANRVAFRTAIEAAVGQRGAPAQVVGRLAPGALVVIDDLDLWWERRPGGLDAIDELLALIAEAGERVGFLLAGGSAAVRLLGALRPLSRFAYTQVDCPPLGARDLERVIMARHASTGLQLRLGKRTSETLGAWTRARLFDAHFDHARGNVGYALRSWIAHVEACAEGVLSIRVPDRLDWDAIDDLRPELVAMLVELVLHKAASPDKLQRLTERSAAAVASAVGELCSIGLAVQNRRRVVQINPFVHIPVVDWLARRELV